MVFCPLIADKCKKDKCILWENGNCLLSSFMESVAYGKEIEVPAQGTFPSEEINVPPDEIKDKRIEELAKELVDFLVKEFPEELVVKYLRSISYLSAFFWQTKGVDTDYFEFYYPKELVFKIRKINHIAEWRLKKYFMEKEMVSSLSDSCVNWLKKFGISRVTKNDIEAFLLENRVKLYFPESKSILYHLVKAKI